MEKFKECYGIKNPLDFIAWYYKIFFKLVDIMWLQRGTEKIFYEN